MNNQAIYRLGDLITLKRGYDLPHAARTPGQFPIVSSSGVTGTHKESMVEGPGVVTGRYGTLGKVFYIPGKFWPLNTSLYVQSFKGNDPRFVAYYLRTILSANFNSAGAVPGVNRNVLHKLAVPTPPIELATQRKIAAILTAYDDLIETNKRRIALLEKMAGEIYREWFVRMRFPGYQDTSFDKCVPEGWVMTKIEKAFEFTGGGTPSKSTSRYWNDGTVNWFTPSDITGSAGIYLSESRDQCTDEGVSRSSARMFPAYSVMMTSRATIGAIGINMTSACTNQGFITCLPNERYPLPYLYQWLKLAKPYFEQLCGGATFPELTKGTFKKLEILTPPQMLVEDFVQTSSHILKAIEVALEENRTLTKTRDLLLPRLISGKLSVEELDIRFPPSMRDEAEELEAADA